MTMSEWFCCGTIIACILCLVGILYVIRKWADGGRCLSTARLDGKTVIITGANTGIGKETAVDLAKRGAMVIMACRDVKRGESALQNVRERSGSTNVVLKILDLSSLASIQAFVTSFLMEYKQLHILVNNAGVMMCPYMKTEDGFEMQMGVNHFGHFALTNLLLQRMVESPPSRIVNVSSVAHNGLRANINFDDINFEKSYDRLVAYGSSKLANVLFAKELNRKIIHTGVTTYVLHPGIVAATGLGRYSFIFRWFNLVAGHFLSKNPEQGAQTSIYCAVQEGIENLSGMYFSDCTVKESSKLSNDEGMAKKLWEISEEMTNVKYPM